MTDKESTTVYHSALCNVCNQLIYIHGFLPNRAESPSASRPCIVKIDRFHAAECNCPHWKIKLTIMEGFFNHISDSDVELTAQFENEKSFVVDYFYWPEIRTFRVTSKYNNKSSFSYKVGTTILEPVSENVKAEEEKIQNEIAKTSKVQSKRFYRCGSCYGIGGERCIFCKGSGFEWDEEQQMVKCSANECTSGFRYVCSHCNGRCIVAF